MSMTFYGVENLSTLRIYPSDTMSWKTLTTYFRGPDADMLKELPGMSDLASKLVTDDRFSVKIEMTTLADALRGIKMTTPALRFKSGDQYKGMFPKTYSDVLYLIGSTLKNSGEVTVGLNEIQNDPGVLGLFFTIRPEKGNEFHNYINIVIKLPGLRIHDRAIFD